MKKLFLLFALVLTICSTAMAEDLYLESEVGTIGTLNGREAIVVDLGGTIGKVAVAIMNVGAEGQQAKYASVTCGTKFNLGDANDPDKNGLTDGWYVPSKAEMEALKKNLTPNKNLHCVEWKVTDNATLYLPTWHSSSSTPYYGYYVTSDRVKEDDTWKCWIYFFNFYDSDNTFGGNYFEKDDEQETEGCLIRPFHKLPSMENRRIYYVTIDGEKLVPSNKNTPFNVANDNIENEKDEKTGKWRITTLNHDITTIDVMAFCYCSRLSSIILPSTVSRIRQKAFDDCSNLLYVIFKGTQPATIELDHITGSGIFFGSGINVGGTVTLVPSGAATAYRDAGFPNVYDGLTDDLKNKLLGNITTVMNGIKNPENISATINACKDGISNGTDITTVMNIYETAMLTITLQKEKEAALRKIDELVTKANSLDLDGIEDYLALLEKCRSNIVSASGILEVEAVITQAMADLTPYRYMAKKDLETYLSTNHIHNFSIESYLTRIFEATSDESIDAIVSEAIKTFEEMNDKFRIGNDWYVLKAVPVYRDGWVHDYFLENCPMTFTDAAEYVSDFEFTADEVHYSRDLTPVEGVWQCWYVPFDVTVDNTKFDAAEIEGLLLNADGETIVAFRKLADGATMHANKVYVIRAKAGEGKLELTLRNVMVYDAVQQNKVWYADVPPLVLESAHEYFVFYGHYDYSEPWTLTTSWYGFYTLNDKGQFSIRNSSDKIKPQRFWLVVGEQTNGYYPAEQHATAKEFIDMMVLGDEEEVTGIEASPKSSPEGKDLIYNLQGQRVNSIQKGQVYIMNGKKYIAK